MTLSFPIFFHAGNWFQSHPAGVQNRINSDNAKDNERNRYDVQCGPRKINQWERSNNGTCNLESRTNLHAKTFRKSFLFFQNINDKQQYCQNNNRNHKWYRMSFIHIYQSFPTCKKYLQVRFVIYFFMCISSSFVLYENPMLFSLFRKIYQFHYTTDEGQNVSFTQK